MQTAHEYLNPSQAEAGMKHKAVCYVQTVWGGGLGGGSGEEHTPPQLCTLSQ